MKNYGLSSVHNNTNRSSDATVQFLKSRPKEQGFIRALFRFPTGCLPLDSYSSVNQLLSYGTYSAKWVRRFVGVNDPEGRLPCLAGGLTSARVIFPG